MTIKQKKSRKEDASYDSERTPQGAKRRKRGSFETFENWTVCDLPQSTRELPDFSDKIIS